MSPPELLSQEKGGSATRQHPWEKFNEAKEGERRTLETEMKWVRKGRTRKSCKKFIHVSGEKGLSPKKRQPLQTKELQRKKFRRKGRDDEEEVGTTSPN